jgi:hypothetical protein
MKNKKIFIQCPIIKNHDKSNNKQLSFDVESFRFLTNCEENEIFYFINKIIESDDKFSTIKEIQKSSNEKNSTFLQWKKVADSVFKFKIDNLIFKKIFDYGDFGDFDVYINFILIQMNDMVGFLNEKKIDNNEKHPFLEFNNKQKYFYFDINFKKLYNLQIFKYLKEKELFLCYFAKRKNKKEDLNDLQIEFIDKFHSELSFERFQKFFEKSFFKKIIKIKFRDKKKFENLNEQFFRVQWKLDENDKCFKDEGTVSKTLLQDNYINLLKNKFEELKIEDIKIKEYFNSYLLFKSNLSKWVDIFKNLNEIDDDKIKDFCKLQDYITDFILVNYDMADDLPYYILYIQFLVKQVFELRCEVNLMQHEQLHDFIKRFFNFRTTKGGGNDSKILIKNLNEEKFEMMKILPFFKNFKKSLLYMILII